MTQEQAPRLVPVRLGRTCRAGGVSRLGATPQANRADRAAPGFRERLQGLCKALDDLLTEADIPEPEPSPSPNLEPLPPFARSEALKRLIAERGKLRDAAVKGRLFLAIKDQWRRELEAHSAREDEHLVGWLGALGRLGRERADWRERERSREARLAELRSRVRSLQAAIAGILPRTDAFPADRAQWYLLRSGP